MSEIDFMVDDGITEQIKFEMEIPATRCGSSRTNEVARFYIDQIAEQHIHLQRHL